MLNKFDLIIISFIIAFKRYIRGNDLADINFIHENNNYKTDSH